MSMLLSNQRYQARPQDLGLFSIGEMVIPAFATVTLCGVAQSLMQLRRLLITGFRWDIENLSVRDVRIGNNSMMRSAEPMAASLFYAPRGMERQAVSTAELNSLFELWRFHMENNELFQTVGDVHLDDFSAADLRHAVRRTMKTLEALTEPLIIPEEIVLPGVIQPGLSCAVILENRADRTVHVGVSWVVSEMWRAEP